MNCRICGEANPARARFCLGCGGSMVPPAVSGADAAGERFRASVLFADIERSTALIAGMDAEQARELLDEVLNPVIKAVQRHGGSFFGQAGDGIKAVFGAPRPMEDHALRACSAALEIQLAVGHLPRGVAQIPVRVRVGISSGEVLMRAVKTDLHVEYAAEGPTTHLAAKAEKAARPGTTLLTADTAALVRHRVHCRAMDQLPIDGMQQPIKVYELLGIVPEEGASFHVRSNRDLTPLVGREAERMRIERRASSAAAGQAQAVLVVGEAGVGKSRLIWELQQSLARQGWQVHATGPNVHGARSAYFPVLSLLRNLYGIRPGDCAQRIRDALAQHSAVADLDVSPLLAMLDLPTADASWEAMDPHERRSRLRHSFAAMIQAAARERTLLVLEDLHWADGESLDFLAALVRQLGAAKLLVVMATRPDAASAWQSHDRLEVLPLQPFDDRNSRALFRAIAGSDSSLDRLEQLLLTRVDGNAFFIEESVQMLKDGGILQGDTGNLKLDQRVESLAIPLTVADVLATRIMRLPERDRELLQTAAVLGAEVAVSPLRELTGWTAQEIESCTARLIDARLLAHQPDNPGTLRFRHAFTQQVAYDSMLRKHRRALHAQLLELLESAPAALRAERVAVLAHHAVCAERWPQAVAHLHLAAQEAYKHWAMREAVRLIDEALQRVVPRLPPMCHPDDWRVDLRLAIRGPLVALGQVQRLAMELAEAQAIADASDDLARQCRVAVFACGHHWFMGEHRQAVDIGRRALSMAVTLGDDLLLVPLRQYLGGALHALGDHRAAQELLSANIASVPESAPGTAYGMAGFPAVFCRGTRCWSHEQLGDFEAAMADAQDSMRIAKASGHGFSTQGACFALGNLLITRGDFSEASVLLRDALAISTSQRHGMWVPLLGPLLSVALARLGRHAEAEDVVDRTVPQPEHAILTTFVRLAVVEAYSLLGRLDRAEQLAETTLKRATSRHERIWTAEARRLLGEVALMRGPAHVEASIDCLQRSLDDAGPMGMRPLQARCHLRLAEARMRTADQRGHAAASAHLAQAERLYHDMGLSYWTRETARLRDRFSFTAA